MAGAAQPRYRAKVVARGARGSRASRIRWDRLGRVVLVLVIMGVLVSYIGPTLRVFDTWRESRAGEARLQELSRENAALTEQAKELDKPAAAKVEARKLGLLAEGERGYVIDDLR
jgi:cell division protein FtsB